MADVLRSCTKTGCRWPAAASLSYRYATRQVWLLDLASAPDPSLYDLCPHHADHMVVPKGWERVDDRTVQEVMVEPSAFDRAEEAARRRMAAVEPMATEASRTRPAQLVGAGSGRNRYAALVEQLPQLAAEAHAGDPGSAEDMAEPTAEQDIPAPPPATEHPAARSAAPAPPADPPPADPAPGPLADRGRMGPTTGAGRPAAPVPARDLAPLAADDMTPAGAAEQPPAAHDSADQPPPTDEPLPGQLSIPVDELDSSSGVVLQFDLAGGRRRGKSS